MINDHQNVVKEGQYLTFLLNSQIYGVPIAAVREINEVTEINPIPKTPDFVIGVMNLRGKVVPVVDLRMKFGMRSIPNTPETCIIVIDTQVGQVGTIVDSVCEVIELSNAQIEPPPILGDSNELSFVSGVGLLNDKVIILIDIIGALSKEEFMKTLVPPSESDTTNDKKGNAA